MISGVVYLLRIFKMFHGLMNNPVYSVVHSNVYDTFLVLTQIDGIWEQNFELNNWT